MEKAAIRKAFSRAIREANENAGVEMTDDEIDSELDSLFKKRNVEELYNLYGEYMNGAEFSDLLTVEVGIDKLVQYPSFTQERRVKRLNEMNIVNEMETVKMANVQCPKCKKIGEVYTLQEATIARGDEAQGFTYMCSSCKHRWVVK